MSLRFPFHKTDAAHQARERTLDVLEDVFAGYPMRNFTVRLWDGTTWPQQGAGSPAFTLVLNHPGALREMFLPPTELNLGEAYIYGDYDSDCYVFPDGELTPISHSLRIAEELGFEVRDVESLREHYARTLRRWVRRLERHYDQALEHVEEVTYRIWRLFMSGSADGFQSGRLNVYQSLLAKPGPRGQSSLPPTREDLYVDALQP